jgi:pimeloyl-ACP methyl ester carboxylesterase
VISTAAEAAPEAIDRLIYLAASLLPRGQTMNGAWRAFTDRPAEWIASDAEGLSFTIAEGAYHRLFCPDSDAETAARAEKRLRAEPIAAFMAPMRITPRRFGCIPRAYIEARRDQIIPLDFQRAMQARLPCEQVVRLDADHSPFLAMPGPLAEALAALAD